MDHVTEPMNVDSEVAKHISQLHAEAMPLQEIKKRLIARGLHPQVIESGVREIPRIAISLPYPKVQLRDFQTTISLGDGRTARILLNIRMPRLTLLGDFVNLKECNHLIKVARPTLYRSMVVVNGLQRGKTSIKSYVRTSAEATIQKTRDATVMGVYERLSRITGWPIQQMEDMQIIRYEKAEDFTPHYDYLNDSIEVDEIPKHEIDYRVATAIIYLNAPNAGGCTSFVDIEADIYPQQGNILIFSYPEQDATSLTMHAGTPVISGVKWIATIFLKTHSLGREINQ